MEKICNSTDIKNLLFKIQETLKLSDSYSEKICHLNMENLKIESIHSEKLHRLKLLNSIAGKISVIFENEQNFKIYCFKESNMSLIELLSNQVLSETKILCLAKKIKIKYDIQQKVNKLSSSSFKKI